MKKTQIVSVLCATVLSLASLPSHALLIDDQKAHSRVSVLDIIPIRPGTPATSVTWYAPGTLVEGFTLGKAIGWRQLNIVEASQDPETVFPRGRTRTSPVDNGDVFSVPEPPMLLLLASGLVGLIWSARMKSA
jgi:hypothetical protein